MNRQQNSQRNNFSATAALVIFVLFGGPVVGSEPGLVGLWEAERRFGPTIDGPLMIRPAGDDLIAEIAGHRAVVDRDGNTITFEIAGGRFRGVVEQSGDIRGYWLQEPSRFDGNVFATPLRLASVSRGWQGNVVPQPDTGTFYLLLAESREQISAQLINPERNVGVFSDLTHLVKDGNAISLVGKFRGRGDEQEMFRGNFFDDEDIIGIRYPGRGGAYDFRRVIGTDSDFFARRDGKALSLDTPPLLDDGWQTASAAEVGIDAERIAEMIEQHILPETRNTHDLSIHNVLIARHGKLVVEEYFHGHNRNFPHDSRSASKSVTAILAAATMHAGENLDWNTPVYPFFETAQLLQREPHRAEITLRHLVNMNTGLDCDDRNPESAAYEDYLWDHGDELDFYKHTMNVAVMHPPGAVAAYCSASANLAGGLIAESTGKDLLNLLDRLVAEPLDIARYSVPHSPDGHPFMGGGIRWLARDFLKFPQLLLNDGTWNGKRLVHTDDVERMLNPAVQLDGGRDYGYLWWIEDYPFRGGTVRAHFMGGNGGQVAMLIPELDLSIVFNAGNYSDRVMFRIQQELIPNYILPAISD